MQTFLPLALSWSPYSDSVLYWHRGSESHSAATRMVTTVSRCGGGGVSTVLVSACGFHSFRLLLGPPNFDCLSGDVLGEGAGGSVSRAWLLGGMKPNLLFIGVHPGA